MVKINPFLAEVSGGRGPTSADRQGQNTALEGEKSLKC
jgi:hypothetical protein